MMERGVLPVVCLCLFALACGRAAESYLKRGEDHLAAGRVEEAAMNFRLALQKDSKLGRAYLQLGVAESKLQNIPNAQAAFSRAVELMPDSEEARAQLADIILSRYLTDARGQKWAYDKLVELSDQLLKRKPDSYEGHRVAGYVALADSRPDLAVTRFELANRSRPNQPEIILALAQSLVKAGREKEGEQLADRFISVRKDFGPIYQFLYRYYVERGRTPDAERVAQARAEANPGDSEALLQLAAHHARRRNREAMDALLSKLSSDTGRFPDGPLLAGDFYLSVGLREQALRLFRNCAAASEPRRSVCRLRAARLLLVGGRAEEQAEGLRIVGEMLKDDPQDRDARLLQAVSLVQSGVPEKLTEGVGQLKRLAAEVPDSATLLFALGQAYLIQGDKVSAGRELNASAARQKGFLPPLWILARLSCSAGEYRTCLQNADRILAVQPTNPQARLLRTGALLGMGDHERARTELMELTRQMPGSRNAKLQLAMAQVKQGRLAEAEKILRELIKTDLSDVRPVQGLTEVLLLQRKPEAAERVWLRELERAPESEAASTGLAEFRLRSGRPDMAAEAYRKLLTSRPNDPGLLMAMAEAQRQGGDIDDAIQTALRAAALAPGTPGTHVFLAKLLESRGRKSEAVLHYRQALVLQPANWALMNNLAWLLSDTDATVDEALQLALRASRAQPDSPEIKDTLGWVYLAKRQHDSALHVFRSLVSQYPENAGYRYHLGLALMRAGQASAGRGELEAALRNKPSAEERRQIEGLLRGR